MKKVLCFLVCITFLHAAQAQDKPQPCKGPAAKLIPFLKGNKWGFSDKTGKLVIPAVYDEAFPFGQSPRNTELWYEVKEGEAYVTKGKAAFWIGKNGKTRPVTGGDENPPPQIAELMDSEGSWPSNYSANGKKGFIFEGDTVPAIYDDVRRMNATDYLVRTGRKFGVVDGKKNIVVPLEFEEIREMRLKGGAIAYEVLNEKLLWGMYSQGKVVLPVKYKSIERMNSWDFEWYNVQNEDNTCALIDGEGKVIGSAHQWIERYEGETDRFCVKDNDKWGFLDSKGIVQIPCKYDSVEAFDYETGLALVTMGKRSFYVDCKGTEYCSK